MTGLKGVVIKTRGRWMWVATVDRRFMRFPVPPQGAEPGQEVWVDPSRAVASNHVYRGALVASLLVLLLLGTVLAKSLPSRGTATYLALDINPSLELAVNSSGRVTDVQPLNMDARSLLKGLSLKGKEVYAALDAIVRQAGRAGYISPARENLILLAIVPARAQGKRLEPSRLKEVLLSEMAQMGAGGTVGIQTASLAEREKARQEGVSVNSYLLSEKASRLGLASLLPPQGRAGAAEIAKNLSAGGVSLEQLVDEAGATHGSTQDDRMSGVPEKTPADPLPGTVSRVDREGSVKLAPGHVQPTGGQAGYVGESVPGPAPPATDVHQAEEGDHAGRPAVSLPENEEQEEKEIPAGEGLDEALSEPDVKSGDQKGDDGYENEGEAGAGVVEGSTAVDGEITGEDTAAEPPPPEGKEEEEDRVSSEPDRPGEGKGWESEGPVIK